MNRVIIKSLFFAVLLLTVLVLFKPLHAMQPYDATGPEPGREKAVWTGNIEVATAESAAEGEVKESVKEKKTPTVTCDDVVYDENNKGGYDVFCEDGGERKLLLRIIPNKSLRSAAPKEGDILTGHSTLTRENPVEPTDHEKIHHGIKAGH